MNGADLELAGSYLDRGLAGVANGLTAVGKGLRGTRLGGHLWDTFCVQPYAEPDHKKDAVYKVNGKKPNESAAAPQMAADSTVFCIGKVFQNRIWKILLFGGLFAVKPDDKIYGEEFIKASLHYLFRNLKSGQKVKVIVCGVQSELLNGEEDVRGAYSDEEQKRLIGDIARSFGRADGLEIISLDEVPENVSLFARLNECRHTRRYNKGARLEVDIEEAYGTGGTDGTAGIGGSSGTAGTEKPPTLSARPDALEIARLLYYAIKQPANFKIRNKFFNLKPARIKGDEDYPGSSNYYGLTEIAIRLSAILHGQYIHGGAERQKDYDDIILAILKAGWPRGKGNQPNDFAAVKELRPLYDLLKGTRPFETIHVNTGTNFYEVATQKRFACSRRFLYLNLAATAVLAAYTAYGYHEIDRRNERLFNDTSFELADPDLRPENFLPSSLPFVTLGSDGVTVPF